jgi:hypothetical protein
MGVTPLPLRHLDDSLAGRPVSSFPLEIAVWRQLRDALLVAALNNGQVCWPSPMNNKARRSTRSTFKIGAIKVGQVSAA